MLKWREISGTNKIRRKLEFIINKKKKDNNFNPEVDLTDPIILPHAKKVCKYYPERYLF